MLQEQLHMVTALCRKSGGRDGPQIFGSKL